MLGKRKGWTVLETDVAVKGSLRDLGSFNITNGNYRHEVGMFFFFFSVFELGQPFLQSYYGKSVI